MSWAADNPEAYDEIERKGVAARIESEMQAEGFILEPHDYDTIRAIVETLQRNASGPTMNNVWSQLTNWAEKDVVEAEADHFASQGDN